VSRLTYELSWTLEALFAIKHTGVSMDSDECQNGTDSFLFRENRAALAAKE
jgi:hypothetical protein